jgi:hypothetical protein
MSDVVAQREQNTGSQVLMRHHPTVYGGLAAPRVLGWLSPGMAGWQFARRLSFVGEDNYVKGLSSTEK